MRDPIPGEAPVMLALSEVEGTAQSDPLQLASLALPVVEYRPEPRRMVNIEQIRKEVEASLVFYPQHTNRYLELEKEKAGKEDDFDPIYTYDLNGNRTSMIDPTGITTYTYDALNRLTSITNNKGLTTTFTYDALGRRTSMTHGNGVQTTYNYDAASQLTRLAHQLGAVTVNSFDYSYDRVGNRTSKTSRDGAHNYTYDTLNRLIEAINPLPTNPLETYQYDAVGNRTNSNQNGASIFNSANQLTEDTAFTYQYDANGNQTRKTNKTTREFTQFEYTAENQLVHVIRNGTTINYKYDGLGRRVEKEVISASTTVTRYIYDNEDILLELDGSNNITARYTHGPGIDEPLVMERGGASFFYHADGLGSITEITNQVGTVVQAYSYSSFGKIESQLDPNFVQPYTFTAREFDPETGLHFYQARYYDPNTGRFLSEDPFPGNPTAPQSQNLYPYVGNRPLNFVDPTGKIVINIAFGIIGAGISVGLDVVSGRPVDWGEAVKSGALGLIGGNTAVIARVFLSGGITLIHSTIKELTDCEPGLRLGEIATDVLSSALTGAIGSPLKVKGGIPFEKLHKVTDARNNAYLYKIIQQRIFQQNLYDTSFAVGNQIVDRTLDKLFFGNR